MPGLLFKNVNKVYPGGRQAIRDFNLEIKEHEALILSGPDRCGKSTLLRMIAGLEEITSGTLYIDGVDVTNAEPRERNVAMIFRNSILYPNMTVRDNLTFALRMAKMAPEEIEKRVQETVAALNIGALIDKLPDELTTFQTYQVVFGRALMRRPKVLLMDNAIADLDEELQEEIREKFVNIHEKMNMTVIYATENQKSAMAVGSRMLVMNEGEICQDDAPCNLFERPKNSFVAGVVGYPPMNFFAATVYEEGGKTGLNFKKGKVLIPKEKGEPLLECGYLKKEVLVGVRADALRVVAGKKKGGEGTLTCKLQGMEQKYSQPMLRFIMDESFGLCVTEDMPAGGEESSVVLEVDASKIQIFDKETERTIVY